MSIWVWGLLAVGLVGLRIIIVARGNVETALALLQNLNVTAIVLATFVPFIAVGVLGIWLFLVAGFFNLYRKTPPPKWNGNGSGNLFGLLFAVTVLGVFGLAVAHYAMSAYDLRRVAIATGVVLGLILLLRFKAAVVRGLVSLVLVLGLMAAIVWGTWQIVGQERPWLPRENLELAGWWDTGVVYVLSSDEVWTKYLDDRTRTVRAVPTKNVKARYSVGGR